MNSEARQEGWDRVLERERRLSLLVALGCLALFALTYGLAWYWFGWRMVVVLLLAALGTGLNDSLRK